MNVLLKLVEVVLNVLNVEMHNYKKLAQQI